MKPYSTFLTCYKVKDTFIDVTVQLYCEQDDVTLDDVIGDAEDREALERKIERGDLMIASIGVRAFAFGCEGSDFLGGCYVSEPHDVEQTVAEHSMVANACNDLARVICEQANLLRGFAS